MFPLTALEHIVYTTLRVSTLIFLAADDIPVWKVARYTSAAPTYFTECDEYVDGGLMANNPSHEGLKAIRDFYPNLHIALVVSLGAGKYDEQEIKEADIITCLRSFRIRDAAFGLKKLIESALQVGLFITLTYIIHACYEIFVYVSTVCKM